jgi:hypothetical protein
MVSFTFDEVPKSAATVVGPILAEYNIAEPARATWLPQPGMSPASGRPIPIHPVADAHPVANGSRHRQCNRSIAATSPSLSNAPAQSGVLRSGTAENIRPVSST